MCVGECVCVGGGGRFQRRLTIKEGAVLTRYTGGASVIRGVVSTQPVQTVVSLLWRKLAEVWKKNYPGVLSSAVTQPGSDSRAAAQVFLLFSLCFRSGEELPCVCVGTHTDTHTLRLIYCPDRSFFVQTKCCEKASRRVSLAKMA